ncbi:lipid A biosynthesis acyltransferase [Aquimarina sp. AD10]|uniref:lysophospholipid acyltransferase family protein n=1 Tax=Aquimarina TaxID=290174 RepID=UPI000E5201FF|nr:MULTISPECIES: lysophospholipid acyltransferase family protein [Aquimarina]AXT59090.1 lipid A biosynthesis acyltransferase [Aquimarina sp. AD10]RKM92123.1 lipid A biosynthesis acyltransferase [Aquimarina sp. AD10]
MHLLIYRVVYPILWCISKLPWGLFYAFSTGIYYFVYYIIGYRKKAVKENLELVFPQKTPKEIKQIRKGFYKHMCDMFLEMIKSISISNEEMIKRFKVTNLDDLKNLEAKGKSMMVFMAHYASYEWSNVVDIQTKIQAVGIYKPLGNIYFDRLVQRIRARFGSRLIPNRNAMKEITKDQKKDGVYMYGLVSDQSPKLHRSQYWTDFMGIKVPTFVGAEVLAKRLDLNVFYLKVSKIKRGYYEATFVPITDDPKSCEDYAIVKDYLRMLEEQIYKEPQYYLWTHKRWKHRNAEKPKGATVD